jgi:gamma-glutamyl phosphate reductase
VVNTGRAKRRYRKFRALTLNEWSEMKMSRGMFERLRVTTMLLNQISRSLMSVAKMPDAIEQTAEQE